MEPAVGTVSWWIKQMGGPWTFKSIRLPLNPEAQAGILRWERRPYANDRKSKWHHCRQMRRFRDEQRRLA